MENQDPISIKRKIGISILFGLITLLLSPYGIETFWKEVPINIPWTLFLPILAALAYGWQYGLLSGLSGGALFPFLLWANNGWSNIGTSLIFAGTYALLGFFNDRNQIKSLKSLPIRIIIPLSLSILCFYLYNGFLFNSLLGLNPPFWDPDALKELPQDLILGFALKDSINLVILTIASETLIRLSFIRRLLGIPTVPAMRANSKILIVTITTFLIVWFVYAGLVSALLKEENILQGIHYSLALFVLLASSFFVSIILFNYNEYQFIIKDNLNKSEGKFRALFENANDAIFILNEGTIIDCNPATLKILGCTMTEIIGRTPSFFSPEYQPDGCLSDTRAEELIKISLQGTSQRFEWQHQRLDGTIFDAEISLNRIDINHQVLLQAIVRDVSDRKKAEETISMLAHAIRSISECISITDMEDRIIFVNSAFLHTYQYEEHELLGKSVKMVQSPNNSQSVLNEILPSTLRGGWQGELLNLRKDGSEFPISLSTSIIYDEKGLPIAIIGVATNITRRKQAEEALLVSEEKYRTIFENVQDVFFQTDLQGIVTEISPSIKYYSDFNRDEIIGAPVENLYYNPADRNLLLQEIFHKGEISDYQLMLKTKAGIIKHASINARLITNPDGSFKQISGSIRDITERKRAEMELIKAKEKAEESDRLKSAFLANMSHEIRTPMNGILGFAELLKEPNLNGDEQRFYIQLIEQSGGRMLNLINNLIDISKIESEEVKFKMSSFDVINEFENVFSLFRIEAEEKGLKLIINHSLTSNVSRIRTDSEKFNAIFINLISNAIKFTSHGFVEFGGEKKGDYFQFYVKDSGVGIDPEHHEIVFDSFRQASESLSRPYEGAGLGLSISKSYVEMLGGRIWVESQIGKGSVFYFTLPFSRANAV